MISPDLPNLQNQIGFYRSWRGAGQCRRLLHGALIKTAQSFVFWLAIAASAEIAPPATDGFSGWLGNGVLARAHSGAVIFGLPDHHVDKIEMRNGELVVTTAEEDSRGARHVRIRSFVFDQNQHEVDGTDKVSTETVRAGEDEITFESERMVLGLLIVVVGRWSRKGETMLEIDRHIVARGLFSADEHLILLRRR
jgi:hypothetical protein